MKHQTKLGLLAAALALGTTLIRQALTHAR
jgi:hypothetical protein